MDLSEVKKFEAKKTPVKAVLAPWPEVDTAQLVNALKKLRQALEKDVLDAFYLSDFAETTSVVKDPRGLPVHDLPRLLRRLADLLVEERPALRCEQITGSEGRRVSQFFHQTPLCEPMPLCVGLSSESVVEPLRTATELREVWQVCAVGKVGLYLTGDPYGWRSLSLPSEVSQLLIGLNDKGGLSFDQIAKHLRRRATAIEQGTEHL